MAAQAYNSGFHQLFSKYDGAEANFKNGLDVTSTIAFDLADSLAHGSIDIPKAATPEFQLKALENSVKNYIRLSATTKLQRDVLAELNTMLVNGDEGVDRDVVKTFKRMYEEKLTAWEALSDAEKYHKEEEYVEFKRKLWEKRFPNKPFRIDRDAPEEGDDGGDDDDLEIAIVGGNQNLLCPLTQSLLREPVTSQVCKHSYSREAIQQHIRIQSRGNQRAECPVAGCKHYIASRDLKQNKELARLVSRKEAQSRMEREVEDDEYVVMH